MIKFLLYFLLWSSQPILLKADPHDFFGTSDEYFEDDPAELEEELPVNYHPPHVNFTHEGCQLTSVTGISNVHKYYPIKNQTFQAQFRLLVRLRGKSDGQIMLSPIAKSPANTYYLIAIGARGNTITYFDLCTNGLCRTMNMISTLWILSEEHYRGFIVQFDATSGDLILFPENSETPILYWKDRDPLEINFFTFLTGSDNVSLHVAFNCNATDSHSTVPAEELILDFVFGGTPDPRIRKQLLVGYDALSKPYPYMTTVTIPFISVIHYDIDDQAQTFEVHAWVVMNWRDDRLKWANYSVHDTSGYIHFARKEIWTPEIATYNTAKPTVMNDFAEDAQILVQSNGSVLWVPPVRFITNCKMNLLQWPFDEQRCYIKIGSWTYNENEIDLRFDPQATLESRIKVMSYEGHTFPNNTQWIVRDSSAVRTAKKYTCCVEKYVDMTYYFTLGRKSSIFTFTLVLPVLMITVVSVTGFLVPLAGSSRIILAGINFLVITAYMIYFRMRLPTIDHVPAIVRFFTWNLFMTTLNMTLTVTLVNVTAGKSNSKIPDWAKVLLNSKVVSYITLGEKLPPARRGSIIKARVHSKKGDGESALEEVNDISISTKKPKKGDWVALVDLFDKACFTLFSIISFIMAIALLV